MKTLNNSTKAAVPGNLSVSKEKYLAYFGTGAADRAFRRLGIGLPRPVDFIPEIKSRADHWTMIQEHIRFGCLNPAVVLSAVSQLVAVFTSLTSKGDTPTPVIKVLHERLNLIESARATTGAKFAAASVYFGTPQSLAQSKWHDFSPIIVDCLVDDLEGCENAKKRLKPLAWKCLETALQNLGSRRLDVGLYPVNLPPDMVNNAY